MSFVSAPDHELKEEEELIAKIGRSLCRAYSENDFTRLLKILRNTSKRVLGRELRLERTYKYLRCYVFGVGDVDLIRLSAEDPIGSLKSTQELIYYFRDEVQDKFLLGNNLMCHRRRGYDCLNMFENIELNLRELVTFEYTLRAQELRAVKRLLHNNLDEDHLKYDRGFCRIYLPETPEHCLN